MAIKVLPAEVSRDEERRKMFLDEARLASTVAKAIEHLEMSVIGGFNSLWVAEDPDLEPLHGDPRFEAIIEEVRRGLESPE